jgi:hypothetical protein
MKDEDEGVVDELHASRASVALLASLYCTSTLMSSDVMPWSKTVGKAKARVERMRTDLT